MSSHSILRHQDICLRLLDLGWLSLGGGGCLFGALLKIPAFSFIVLLSLVKYSGGTFLLFFPVLTMNYGRVLGAFSGFSTCEGVGVFYKHLKTLILFIYFLLFLELRFYRLFQISKICVRGCVCYFLGVWVWQTASCHLSFSLVVSWVFYLAFLSIGFCWPVASCLVNKKTRTLRSVCYGKRNTRITGKFAFF